MASSSESDVPLVQRRAQLGGRAASKTPTKKRGDDMEVDDSDVPVRRPRERKRRLSNAETSSARRRKETHDADDDNKESGKQKKWDTLVHSGVLFPPDYEAHGVKMLYNGKPVELTKDQEEVATFFAVMLDTDYVKKETFVKNFWEGFKNVLGPKHVIKDFEKCDFSPINKWHLEQKEKKKAFTKEEKQQLKEEKETNEKKFKTALVDGRVENVGNFRVEPPGLFRGRGDHPKMGKLKARIYPKDITLNLDKDAPVPEHPYPGQKWKEIRHDKYVTWLAFWKDPVNPKEFKYVWLAANSTFKSESDKEKYEKARKLKDKIDQIRKTYMAKWKSSDPKDRQMGTALYFIDELALRAGHEKEEDEADTVGCCTLKVENVALEENNQIKFDFLGKDSIRYENTVKVDPIVYKNVKAFLKEKAEGKVKKLPTDQLFDTFDATDLNKELKDLMPGLSAKVFRTYNASITLNRLLKGELDIETVEGKKASYDAANKQVAILCNHQRAVPKTHENQMTRLNEKIEGLEQELKDMQKELAAMKPDGTGKQEKRIEMMQNRVNKKEAQIEKLNTQAKSKEELKTVALGTSKINYLDPRITVAWCKRNEVPIEKVFNKSLLSKFNWAMRVEPEFAF